jgi:hypothetical protein
LAAALITGVLGASLFSNPDAAVAAEPEKAGTDLGDVFGFTVPTDTLGKGEREVAQEAVGRFGKAEGTYRVIETKTQVGFGVIEGFSVTPGLVGTWASISNSIDGSYSGFTFNGVSVEFKAQLLDRNRHGMGFALIVEPTLGWLDGETGASADTRRIELRAAADWALIPRQLFAGVNILYGSESSSQNGVTEEVSLLWGSAGLSYRFSDAFFLGAEARYMRAYEGLGLGSFVGEALYLGPAILLKPTDKITVTFTWQPQIWGNDLTSSGSLDLTNFERHEAKLKVSMPF